MTVTSWQVLLPYHLCHRNLQRKMVAGASDYRGADNVQSPADAMTTVIMEDEQGLYALMQDFCTRFVSPSSEEQSLKEIRDSHREVLRNVTNSCAAKQQEGERMIQRVQELRAEFEDQNRRIKEKQDAILQEIAKMKENKQLSAELSGHIHQLREELAHKRELALATRKANKEKLKDLQQSAMLFKERLGLEIRKLQGDRLQFVFRCINPKDLEEPYSCIIYFNEDGEYQLSGCDPPLDCITEYERNVRETKNFSALLTNLRKSFAALCTQVK
ncbi:unnamed protein product [Ranitomeya imitator]|uniref:Kinetochore protein SPC25 n=1 Tax=Ranitomeya imitator TaxID=111125 RepID=A0ABN9LQ51_9NEOB|nr:unnamed protein product [Ranitomeya imitator]